jgi:cellobiose phosphorylase
MMMSGPKSLNFVDLPRSFPEVCLLSNGRYSVMLTASGRGYSALKGMDVTRWREDVTCDCWGQYCYIRNLDDGRVWSVGRQPLGRDADHYEAILQPEVSQKQGSVYERCERSLECGLKLGAHGLPLMGTGDWNDGMNKVGAGGKGESVWNGWFMFASLREFAGVAEWRGDGARAFWCRERANLLRLALEEHAWDGLWYRRAYFDDGTPLGSATDDECRIDSIAQSWAVISGAGDPDRARQAMMTVEEQLVRYTDGLILLFTPPFDRGRLDPGYIKGYVPGIRENGGQYTHAATWVVLATALLGNGNRAAQLFDLINPVRHASSLEGVVRYKVEPYVVCADVYGHRTRRLDMVHRFCRLALQSGSRSNPWFPSARQTTRIQSLRSTRMGRLRGHLSPPLDNLPYSCR